jgi:DNA-binding GntR family transcriptional regulator
MQPISSWGGHVDPSALQHLTLKDSAEEIVRRALLSGSMKPGQIYSANSLSAQLGVSNSPTREAMLALAGKGLLEVVRNRGFRVVEMSDRDKQEVYDLRLLIEVEAVRRVTAAGHQRVRVRGPQGPWRTRPSTLRRPRTCSSTLKQTSNSTPTSSAC